MLKFTLKGLIAHKRRLATTTLAVLLGVAFMAGTLVLSDTIGKTFDDLFADVYKNTDAVVRAEAAFEGGPGETMAQRGRVDASLVDEVRKVDGVATAQGTIFGYARLVGKDGEAIGNPEMGAPTVGVDWTDVKELNPFNLVSGGPPVADNDVVIDRKSARDGGLAVGDTTTVLVQAGPQQVRIAGIAKFGTADSPGGASFVMFKPSVAQRLMAQPGKFDDISIIARDGVPQAQLIERIRAILPAGTEVLSQQEITAESQGEMDEAFSFFNTFMLVFAIVALLVGGFMIFNTFSITVAQRTRENGLLRALGASRRQVLVSVLLEAVLIGLIASVIGVAAGVLVASGLKAMLAGFGLDIPTGSVVLTANTVLVSMLAGILVTMVAAVSPARKAAKVAPIAAMHTDTAGSTGYGSKERVIVGIAILGLGAAALFAGLFGDTSNTVQVVGLGIVLVFFGVSVLGRTVSLPLSRLLGAPLTRIRSTTGGLARENAMRNPKRTAASASALMIGVGLVGFITILASSTKASIDAAIDRSVTGDYVVSGGGGFIGGVDPGLAKKLSDLPEVEAATGVRNGFAKVGDSVQWVSALDPATSEGLIDLKPVEGSLRDAGADTIAVHEGEAEDKNLKIGDPVQILFKDTGPQVLRVGLIYREDQPWGKYVLPLAVYDANFADHYDSAVYATRAKAVSTEAGLAAIKDVVKAYPGTKAFDQAGFKEEQARQVNTILGLMYALLALAIVIALLGIGNTLALAIFERTRELGLLRAVGMTRSQLRSTIRWESVIIALQGTLLGLVIGVFFGWALVTALADQGVDVFRIPFANLAVVVVLAGLAGVVAAVAPSRRAAKLNILHAIASE